MSPLIETCVDAKGGVMRVLSGIQPSGELHLGNYFGAIRQYLRLQADHDCFFFVANYHALTTVREPEALRAQSVDTAADYLAFGLDPERATIFLQSDVPEVTELAWILSNVTPMGLLERCHAYKEKVAQGIPANHGLFAYPVLMAADIVIYDSDLVPVGQDQKQHVEVTRDIAEALNRTYGEVLRVPEPYILSEVAVVPGTDGRKMSKSYGNTIPVFEPDRKTRSRIMKIETDSTPVADPKDPDKCNVFNIFRLFADQAERDEVARRYREGGIGYAEVKERLAELVREHFAEIKAKREELAARPEAVRQVLAAGAEKARASARKTLARVRTAVGL
jgi:tryptophanyl-tRNA synthetase